MPTKVSIKVPAGFAIDADRLATAVKQSLLGEGDGEKIWRLNDVPALAQLEEAVYTTGMQGVAAMFDQTASLLGLPSDPAFYGLQKALKRAGKGQGSLFEEESHPRLKAGATQGKYKPGEFVPKGEQAAFDFDAPEPEPEPLPEPVAADPEPVFPEGLSTQRELAPYRQAIADWDDRNMNPEAFEDRIAEIGDSRRQKERDLDDAVYEFRSGSEERAKAFTEHQAYMDETRDLIQAQVRRRDGWLERQFERDKAVGWKALYEQFVKADDDPNVPYKEKRQLRRRANQVEVWENEQRRLQEKRDKRAVKKFVSPRKLQDEAMDGLIKAKNKLQGAQFAAEQYPAQAYYQEKLKKAEADWTKANTKAETLAQQAVKLINERNAWYEQCGPATGSGLEARTDPMDGETVGLKPPIWQAGRMLDAKEARRLKVPEGTRFYSPEEDKQSRQEHDLGNGFLYVGPDEPELMAAARRMKAKVERSIPPAMHARLVAKGGRSVFTAGPPYRHGSGQGNQADYFAMWLSRSKRKPGKGSGWKSDDVIPGVYFDRSKTAYTQVGGDVPHTALGSGSVNTTLHEYGHLVDYQLQDGSGRLSDSVEFQQITEDMKLFTKQYYHEPQELFAEGFDTYTESEANREKLRTGPPAYQRLAAYFDKLFATVEGEPVQKGLYLIVPKRLVKSKRPAAISEPVVSQPMVPEGWLPWAGQEEDEDGGAICWDGSLPPEEIENYLQDDQATADMVNEEE